MKQKGAKKVTCDDCKKPVCFQCKEPWHTGISCRKRRKNQMGEFIVKKNIGYCPKCKTLVEKDGGCPMMNCSKCRYQFCWICGLHDRNPIHMMTIIQCEGLNYKLPDIRKKFLIFFPLVLLAIILMPLLLLITALAYIFMEFKAFDRFDCLKKALDRIFDKIDKKMKSGISKKIVFALFLIFVLVCNLIYWSVIFSVMIAIVIIPIPLLSVLGILSQLNILYRWRPHWLHFSICPSFGYKEP